MKRITFLLAVLSVFVLSVNAQLVPPSTDVYLKNTQTGIVNEIAPYSTGFIYISNDGSNDVVTYTTDGVTFTDAESLESGTAKGLSGWVGSDIAFYLGNNTTDAVGVELRKLDAGTPGYIIDHNPLLDPDQALVTGVDRHYNGSGYDYHYLYQYGLDLFTGATIAPYLTDGTEAGTFELTASNFGVQLANKTAAKMFGTSFNGSYYCATSQRSMLGSSSAVYQIDGTTVTARFTSTDALANLYNLKATSSHLYFVSGNYNDSGDAGLYCMAIDYTTSEVFDNNNAHVWIDDAIDMQVLNDKLYVVARNVNGLKLAEINGTTVKYFNLSAEDESDNILDMVVSGDYVYVLASETGGNTELYAINPSRGDAEFVLASDLDGNYGDEQKMLTAINGGVAFISVTDSGDYIFISDGNDGNTKSLMVENNPTLDVTLVHSTGDKLYILSDNAGDTEIYEYVVAAFSSITKTVTVQEAGTGTLIEGGSVKFDTGLEIYSGTTNASGQVDITAPYGWADAIVTVDGYAKVEEQYYFGDFSSDPTYELSTAKSFAFIVYDETQHDDLFGGGELEGALVELTDGTNTYTASTLGDLELGYANFKDVLYGTYDYTVSMSGYEDETGMFTVDATTIGGLSVGLSPVSTNIKDNQSINIKVFPLPANDFVNIKSELEVSSVDVFNLAGSLVKSVSETNIRSIKVSDLQPGVYVLRIKNIKGVVSNVKIQKQ